MCQPHRPLTSGGGSLAGGALPPGLFGITAKVTPKNAHPQITLVSDSNVGSENIIRNTFKIDALHAHLKPANCLCWRFVFLVLTVP